MNKKGITLILVVSLIMISSLLAAIVFSLLAVGTESGTDFAISMEALAIASGGKEWYLEQLENDADWTNQVNQSGIALGSGSFDITVNSAAKNRVSFTVTANVSDAFGHSSRRQMATAAKRLPKAFLFALYCGRDIGPTLDLRNSGGDPTTINGDYWSRGTTEVFSGSSVTGIAYRPDTEDILGTGSFSEYAITSPYPDMPQINQTTYDNLMNSLDTIIDASGVPGDITQNTDLVLTGNVIGCANFTTTGNITISGNGYIVATDTINLHALGSSSGTLTITPSEGNIYFLANQDIVVNSTSNDTNVTMNPGAYLYSRCSTGTAGLVRIRKQNTTTTLLDGSFIIARRRIIVERKATVINSTLYVSDVSDTNNLLRITDNGTTVGTVGNPCSIISVSGRNPGLIIETLASVTGMVYHWGDTTGRTDITHSSITGSVVASQFNGNQIGGSTITYSEADLPVNPPDGFEDFISTDIDSWNDE